MDTFFRDVTGDFFALQTEIGGRIEHATSELLVSEDLTLNLEICDRINETDDGPDDAVRALKKRLNHENTKIVELALRVLQTCMQNCGSRFHAVIGADDFLLGCYVPIMQKPTHIGEYARRYFKEWCLAFQAQRHNFVSYFQVYDKLQREGIVFPEIDENSYIPIDLPEVRYENPQPQQLTPTPEQRKKLQGDLEKVKNNQKAFQELLNLVPEGTNPNNNELLVEILQTTWQMKLRLLKLVEVVADEPFVAELLETHDKLVTAFDQYHTLYAPFKNKPNTTTTTPSTNTTTNASKTTTPATAESRAPAQSPRTRQQLLTKSNDSSLVDLSDDPLTDEEVEGEPKSNLIAFDSNASLENPFISTAENKNLKVESEKEKVSTSITDDDFDSFLNSQTSPKSTNSGGRKHVLKKADTSDGDNLFD